MAEIDSRRHDLAEQRGQVRTQLGQLASAEEASELRAQREVLQERLHTHAMAWSKYTLASAILQRTRQQYEQERQPGVISQAEKFFTRAYPTTSADTMAASLRSARAKSPLPVM